METSAHPNFKHSLFHEILYRYHVLGEVDLPDPGVTPYYDKEFFSLIHHYHINSPLNVAVMTTKQWYQVLLEDQVLMTPSTDNSPPTLIPTRVEVLQQSWKLYYLVPQAPISYSGGFLKISVIRTRYRGVYST